ncbi:hypothetical protein [Thalassotalea aquiviva]|uniref:hypothetical protein n=1 Tax=Thalassotalea aquiviva TaxID=3242415 RepID=UPI00352A7E2A
MMLSKSLVLVLFLSVFIRPVFAQEKQEGGPATDNNAKKMTVLAEIESEYVAIHHEPQIRAALSWQQLKPMPLTTELKSLQLDKAKKPVSIEHLEREAYFERANTLKSAREEK